MGCLFGAACLVGLLIMLKKHHRGRWGGRCGRGHRGGWGGGGYGGYGDDSWDDGPGPRWGGGGGGSFFRQGILRQLSMRLSATPGQEKVIAGAAEEIFAAGRAAHETLRATKKEVADTFAGPAFDDALLGDVFTRQDEAISGFRTAVSSALTKVHEVLEPEQRRRLAELLARGPGGARFSL